MRVRVELFGRAATQTGEREVALEVPGDATLRDVAAELVARYPVLGWIPEICRPARNLEYARWPDAVSEGDEVSFIPPVSGGARVIRQASSSWCVAGRRSRSPYGA